MIVMNGKRYPGPSDRDQSSFSNTTHFALAHYPSLTHFADMIGIEDYQQANKTWRVPSLKDTCILCTTELDLHSQAEQSKL